MHVTALWCFYFEGVWTGVPPDVELTEGETPPEMASSGKNRDELIQNVQRGLVSGDQTARF